MSHEAVLSATCPPERTLTQYLLHVAIERYTTCICMLSVIGATYWTDEDLPSSKRPKSSLQLHTSDEEGKSYDTILASCRLHVCIWPKKFKFLHVVQFQ